MARQLEENGIKLRAPEPEDNVEKWETISERQEQKADFQKGVFGITHTLPLSGNAYLKTNMGDVYKRQDISPCSLVQL